MLTRLLALVALVVSACHVTAPSPEPRKLGTAIPSYETVTLTAIDAAVGTTLGSPFGGFDRYTTITADCSITTGQGDASIPLDVYLQKLVQTSPDVWVDYVHFPKQSMTLVSTTVTFNVASGYVSIFPVAVGLGTDDASTPVLDAGIIALGHPGNTLRLAMVTGGGTIYTPASVACYFAGR